jgi:hypothetical protein
VDIWHEQQHSLLSIFGDLWRFSQKERMAGASLNRGDLQGSNWSHFYRLEHLNPRISLSRDLRLEVRLEIAFGIRGLHTATPLVAACIQLCAESEMRKYNPVELKK